MDDNNIQPWQLVADIGGTHARFARKVPGENRLLDITSISVAGYKHFHEALADCLATLARDERWQTMPDAACFAMACRVDAEDIRFTNSPWRFTRSDISRQLEGASLDLINDFAAIGYGITELDEQDWQQVGGNTAVPGKPAVILGPGTGLGVSLLVPVAESFVVVDGEGGHVDFAPVDDIENQVLDILRRRFGRVSVERVLCGAGILNVYQALAEIGHEPAVLSSPEAISRAGIGNTDPLATASLQLFCRVLGSMAGNLALTAGALGGVYITGGIVPSMLAFLRASDFRRRFEDKGRFRAYLAQIPVRVVTRQDLGLLGAANRLRLAGY